MSRARAMLSGLGGMVFIGAASLLLAEAAVRMGMPQESPQLWLTPDARYGHVMKPHFHQRFHFPHGDFVMDVRTNALGFRDEEPAPETPGRPTVVFAGDSFTFGHGVAVEDRFDSVARRALEASSVEARFLNTGVSAWGTLQQTRYLTDHLDALKPDIVVLTFCENDPHDDDYFLAHGISFDRVRFPGKDWLRAHSHLFRLAQHTYLVWRKTRAAAAQPAPPAEEQRAQQAAVAARAQAEQAEAAAFAPPISASQWERTEKLLREFMAAWRARQPEARLVLQATDPLNEDIRARLTNFAGTIEGVAFVDLHDAAAALPLPERRLPYDGHWSVAMHRISGEALARHLAPLLKPPATPPSVSP